MTRRPALADPNITKRTSKEMFSAILSNNFWSRFIMDILPFDICYLIAPLAMLFSMDGFSTGNMIHFRRRISSCMLSRDTVSSDIEIQNRRSWTGLGEVRCNYFGCLLWLIFWTFINILTSSHLERVRFVLVLSYIIVNSLWHSVTCLIWQSTGAYLIKCITFPIVTAV